MGSTGVCWDNAVAETFFATLKRELVYRRAWPTRQELIGEILEYIEAFYNRQRRHYPPLATSHPPNSKTLVARRDEPSHNKIHINNYACPASVRLSTKPGSSTGVGRVGVVVSDRRRAFVPIC